MADVFFEQFGMLPDKFLNIAPGTPVSQMAAIMVGMEQLMLNSYKPAVLIVPGDVNSTLAGAMVANKMGIPLAHLEAGLRSFDKTMPEEFNRVLTDDMSDVFFVTEDSGIRHLMQEGKSASAIHFVGNTMIDTMIAFDKEIRTSGIRADLGLKRPFVLITMHRPGNVDSMDGLIKLMELMQAVSENTDIVFPAHPRTVSRMKDFGLFDHFNAISGLKLLEPMAYFDFQNLILHAQAIVTDSGGIQEESTFRRVPCITLRPNTERPVTVNVGTNELIPFEVSIVKEALMRIQTGKWKPGETPALWDGQATGRILKILADKYNG
jgi:UDP-N-acetylglucosamine 2-epimerase (non-hydrolysing)